MLDYIGWFTTSLVLIAATLFGCMLFGEAARPPDAEQLPVKPAEQVSIDGIYRVNGVIVASSVSPKDTPYTGAATVRTVGKLVAINYTSGDIGIGWIENGHLMIGTQFRGGGNSTGRYKIEMDTGKPKLVGKWVSNPSNGQVNLETLTFLAEQTKAEEDE